MECSELYGETQSKAADKKQRRPNKCRYEEQEVKGVSSVSPTLVAACHPHVLVIRVSIEKLKYPCRSAQDCAQNYTIVMPGFMELYSDIKAS